MRILLSIIISISVATPSHAIGGRRRRIFTLPRSTPTANHAPQPANRSLPKPSETTELITEITGQDDQHYQVRTSYVMEPSANHLKSMKTEIISIWNEVTQTWDLFPENIAAPLKRVEKGSDGRWYTIRYYREDHRVRREVFSVWTDNQKWERIVPLASSIVKVDYQSQSHDPLTVESATQSHRAIHAVVKEMEHSIQANSPTAKDLSYQGTALATAIARRLSPPQARPAGEILAKANLNDGPATLGHMPVQHVEVPETHLEVRPTLVIRLNKANQKQVSQTISDFKSAMVHATLKAKASTLIGDLVGSFAGGGSLADLGRGPEMNLRIMIDINQEVQEGYQEYLKRLNEVPELSGAVAARTGFERDAKKAQIAESRLRRGGAILKIVQSKIEQGINDAVREIQRNPRSQTAEKIAGDYFAARLEEGIQNAVLEVAKANQNTFNPTQLGIGIITDSETSKYLSDLIGDGNLGIEFSVENNESVFFSYRAGGSIKDWAVAITKLIGTARQRTLTRADLLAAEKEYLETIASYQPRLQAPASKSPTHR